MRYGDSMVQMDSVVKCTTLIVDCCCLLVFTNVLKKSAIEQLAAADERELVHEVQVGNSCRPALFARRLTQALGHLQEYFADYSPITPSHLSFNCLPAPLSFYETATYVPLHSLVAAVKLTSLHFFPGSLKFSDATGCSLSHQPAGTLLASTAV